jgi:hypothetical protein
MENEEQKKLEVKTNEIQVEDGRLVTTTHTELLRYCAALIKGGGVPKRFETTEQVFAALMLVRELGLPDTAIRQVASIHGTPSLFGDLPLALVQKSGFLTTFVEVFFDCDYNIIKFSNKNLGAEVFGAVCFLSRGSGEVQEFSWTLDDAKKAGVYPASSSASPWSKYTKIMLRYKARALGLKSLFADIISGVAIAEYDFDVTDVNSKDVTPKVDVASELNNLF